MSHSEIAGSKLAHSSPTLIAACHVLHRLYMPRHSPDALTSRLRAHTTNDNPEKAASAYVVINSARYICDYEHRPTVRIRGSIPSTGAAPRHRLKNPFTMSKRHAFARHITDPSRQTATLHLWKYLNLGGAYRDRTDDLMLAKQPLSQLS